MSPGDDLTKLRLLVVIPCLNEVAAISKIIHSIHAQCTAYRTDIVVVDGGSTDGTQKVVREISAHKSNVILLHNSKRLQSAGINLAVETLGADHDYLLRIDAHGDYPTDYCERILKDAINLDADSVVVGMETVGFGHFQKAAAMAQNSKLGNGGSKHRSGGGGQWIDHGHHALMKISAFRAVGGYDIDFSHNEDAELDYRFQQAGYRIWMTSETYMTYYPRSSARLLFKQYIGYGRGRAKNLLKHYTLPKLRQCVPLAVIPIVLLATFTWLSWWALSPLMIWSLGCLSYGLWLGISQRTGYGPIAAFAAMIMHMGWSAGFWLEVTRNARRNRSDESRRAA